MTNEYQKLINKFKTSELPESARKKDVPENWLVFNAFRPISGTLDENGKATVWTAYGVGTEGIHFAAVDPENSDGYSGMWYEGNLRDQAVRIIYREGDEGENDAQTSYFG